MAYTFDKGMEISNHSGDALFFTVNNKCEENMIVGASGTVVQCRSVASPLSICATALYRARFRAPEKLCGSCSSYSDHFE